MPSPSPPKPGVTRTYARATPAPRFAKRADAYDDTPPPVGHPGRAAKLDHITELLDAGYALHGTARSVPAEVSMTAPACVRLLREEGRLRPYLARVPARLLTEPERAALLFDALSEAAPKQLPLFHD